MYCPGTVNKLFLQSKGWVAIFSSHLKSLSERKRIGKIFEAFFQPYNHMSHTFNVDECRNCLWQWLIIFPLRDVQDRKYRTFFGTLVFQQISRSSSFGLSNRNNETKRPPPLKLSLSPPLSFIFFTGQWSPHTLCYSHFWSLSYIQINCCYYLAVSYWAKFQIALFSLIILEAPKDHFFFFLEVLIKLGTILDLLMFSTIQGTQCLTLILERTSILFYILILKYHMTTSYTLPLNKLTSFVVRRWHSW